jgi:hypothetical protein
MSALMSKAMVHWLIIAYIVCFSIASLSMSIVGCLQGANWSEMSSTAHICIIFSILGNWMNILVAFMNKEASKVGVDLGDSSATATTTTATATVATTKT